MFVCRDCCGNYKDMFSFGLSWGPCENCKRTTDCKDIPSSALEIDRNWKDNVEDTLKIEEIRGKRGY